MPLLQAGYLGHLSSQVAQILACHKTSEALSMHMQHLIVADRAAERASWKKIPLGGFGPTPFWLCRALLERSVTRFEPRQKSMGFLH